MSDGLLVGIGVVQPWCCDAMDHLTTRHFVSIFDDASYELLRLIGSDSARDRVAGLGWADVRHEINYHGELRVLTSYHVYGAVLSAGRTSLTLRLDLVNCHQGTVSADMIAKTVRFDLNSRKATPLEPEVRRAAQQLGDGVRNGGGEGA